MGVGTEKKPKKPRVSSGWRWVCTVEGQEGRKRNDMEKGDRIQYRPFEEINQTALVWKKPRIVEGLRMSRDARRNLRGIEGGGRRDTVIR